VEEVETVEEIEEDSTETDIKEAFVLKIICKN